jgi:hypothetical protein
MMESQQMMELLLAMRQEMNANAKAVQEQADANTMAMREDMKADRERAEAENKAWQERMENIWQADGEKTDIKLKELTETVEKTQMELQTADVLYGIPADYKVDCRAKDLSGKMEINSSTPTCANSCCCYRGANVTKPMATDEINPVTRKNFEVLSALGAGAFGKVFLVQKIGGDDSGYLYAMKELVKANIVKGKKITEYTQTEMQVLEAVRHSPSLIGLHYAFQTYDKLHLILDYVIGGDLFDYMSCRQKFLEEVRFYIGEVVLAVE